MLSEFSECALIAVPRVEMPMTTHQSPPYHHPKPEKTFSWIHGETAFLCSTGSVLLQKKVSGFALSSKATMLELECGFSKVLRSRHKSHFPQNETTMTTTKQGTKRDMMIQCVHQSVCAKHRSSTQQ